MVRRAGVIVVDFVAQSSKLQADANQASGKLGQFGKSGVAAGKQIAAGMEAGAVAIRKVGVEAEKTGSSVIRYTAAAAHTAEAVAALATSHLLAAGAMAKYTANATTAAGASDQLVNGYRALRIVLSPTVFTAASLGIGIAVEETIRLVNARARLIDQQSAFAAANRITFHAVDTLDSTSRIAGANQGNVRSLYTGLQSQYSSDQGGVQAALDKLGVKGGVGDPEILGRIAKGLHEVEDPARQAQLAFELFGSQGGLALEELDGKFARSAGAVKKWGLTLDEVSRTQIHQFRQDLSDFKESFFDFADVEAGWQKFKQNIEVVAAAFEDMAKRGVNAINDLAQPIADVLNKAAGIPDKVVPPPPVVPGANRGGPRGPAAQLADDFQAQEEARRRRISEETIEGQRQAASEAERRSDEAMKKLRADATAREADRTARQANPNQPQATGLLSEDQRQALAIEAQSAAALAEVTKVHVREMEASKAVTELLSERFGNLRIEMEKTAIQISAVGKSEEEKRNLEAEEIVQQARVEVARKQVASQTPPGQPVPAPSALQIANAIPADTAQRLKQEVVAELATEAEKAWRVEIDKTSESLLRRISVEEMETDAIGKNFKARQAAKIEGELRNEFGKDYTNPARQPEIQQVRELKTTQADTARAGEVARTNESLAKQVELEKSLAAVQAQGKESIDLVTLAYKLRALSAAGLTGEIANEIALYNARKANADAAEDKRLADEEADSIQKLDLEIEGTKALTAAQLQGAEAVRKQTLANKYTKMGDYDQEFDSVVAKTKNLDTLQNQMKITREALATSQAYSDQLEKLKQEQAVIADLEAKQGATRDLEIDRERIEKDIADTLAKQALATGSLMDGLKAFFTEAGRQAEKPGQILHDGLTHAVDGVSGELAKLTTGQKTDWGHMLQGVGGSVAQQSYKSMLNKGVGWLGGKLGMDLTQKDGQSQQTAFWVQVAGNGGNGQLLPGMIGVMGPGGGGNSATPASGPASDRGRFGGGSLGNGIFSALGKVGGGIAGMFASRVGSDGGSSEPWVAPTSNSAGLPQLPSGLINRTGEAATSEAAPLLNGLIGMIPGFEDGGTPPPNSAYMVGENGPELRVSGSRPDTIVPLNKMGGGGQAVHNHNWNIDARQADLGAQNRIMAGMEETKRQAVEIANRQQQEQMKRTPH